METMIEAVEKIRPMFFASEDCLEEINEICPPACYRCEELYEGSPICDVCGYPQNPQLLHPAVFNRNTGKKIIVCSGKCIEEIEDPIIVSWGGVETLKEALEIEAENLRMIKMAKKAINVLRVNNFSRRDIEYIFRVEELVPGVFHISDEEFEKIWNEK